MNNELIINTGKGEVMIALLENKKLVELHKEKKEGDFSVGDIYLGKVQRIVSGLNAAFVDVGSEKDAFLHYLDLGPQFLSIAKYTNMAVTGKLSTSNLMYFLPDQDINKNGKIGDFVKGGQTVLVQIAKEPISNKGPRITAEVTLAGRFMVLMPFNDKVSISQKIKSAEERDRLKKLLSGLLPKNMGVIVRTAAEGKKVADVEADLRSLIDKWEIVFKELKDAKAPKKILGEMDRSSAILRDLLNPNFNQIYSDDETLCEDLKGYLHQIAPEKEGIVKHYNGRVPIFDSLGIEKQIKTLFGKHVPMASGAYLIVEHTEALHVIDVNSGNTAKAVENQEGVAVRVNMEAAEEVARQLRLRDMGGIIVVDFIDMHEAENRKALFERMKELMKSDRAKHTILPPSKFGLVEITRQRVRPQMDIKTSEKCPSCNGTGEITASVLFVDEIENNLRYLFESNKSNISLKVHPFIEAYIKKGFPSLRMKWYFKYKKWVKVESSNAYSFMEYHFFDSSDEEIVL